ncbi:MAG: hypothetical protein K0V04_18160 [Deltaproteobacteria bacterium]|nr:hypothetical protein [Deltaproteobacteria bacterium]
MDDINHQRDQMAQRIVGRHAWIGLCLLATGLIAASSLVACDRYAHPGFELEPDRVQGCGDVQEDPAGTECTALTVYEYEQGDGLNGDIVGGYEQTTITLEGGVTEVTWELRSNTHHYYIHYDETASQYQLVRLHAAHEPGTNIESNSGYALMSTFDFTEGQQQKPWSTPTETTGDWVNGEYDGGRMEVHCGLDDTDNGRSLEERLCGNGRADYDFGPDADEDGFQDLNEICDDSVEENDSIGYYKERERHYQCGDFKLDGTLSDSEDDETFTGNGFLTCDGCAPSVDWCCKYHCLTEIAELNEACVHEEPDDVSDGPCVSEYFACMGGC